MNYFFYSCSVLIVMVLLFGMRGSISFKGILQMMIWIGMFALLGKFMEIKVCTIAHAEEAADRYDVVGLNEVNRQALDIEAFTNKDVRHVHHSVIYGVPETTPAVVSDEMKQMSFNNCVHNITRTKAYLAHVREWETKSGEKALAWQEGLNGCLEQSGKDGE